MKASLRISSSSSSSSKHAPSLLPLFLICTGSSACLTQSREMWNMERMREQQHSHFSGQGLLKEWKIPAELYGSVPYLSSHPQTAAAAAHVWEIAFIFVLVSSTCLVPHFSALIILISIFFFHWFPDWFFFYIYDYCSALMVSLTITHHLQDIDVINYDKVCLNWPLGTSSFFPLQSPWITHFLLFSTNKLNFLFVPLLFTKCVWLYWFYVSDFYFIFTWT